MNNNYTKRRKKKNKKFQTTININNGNFLIKIMIRMVKKQCNKMSNVKMSKVIYLNTFDKFKKI